MKIKTQDLTDAALDWAVTKCQFIPGTARSLIAPEVKAYSSDWAQGGPIIEREGIAVTCTPEEWCAYSNGGEHPIGLTRKRLFRWIGRQVGPTPLIAAMRCFVASRLGDEVAIPEELK